LGFLFPAIVLMCLDPFMVVLGKPSRVYNFAVRYERRDRWVFHLSGVSWSRTTVRASIWVGRRGPNYMLMRMLCRMCRCFTEPKASAKPNTEERAEAKRKAPDKNPEGEESPKV